MPPKPKKIHPHRKQIIVDTQHLRDDDDDETQVQDADLECGQRFIPDDSEDLFAGHHLPPPPRVPVPSDDDDGRLPDLTQTPREDFDLEPRGDDDHADDPGQPHPARPASTEPSPGGSRAPPKDAAGGKKSYRAKNRPPKTEIPAHIFTEAESQKIVQFLKDNVVLYDRNHPEYHNSSEKDRLWKDFARDHMEGVHWMRCRAHYDTGRSDLGKILNREDKSGATAPYNRTQRAQAVFEKWGFLEQYIRTYTKRRTIDSATGGGGGDATESDHASMSSGLSQHSIQRRQKQKKDDAAQNVPPTKKTRRPTSDQEEDPAPGPSTSQQDDPNYERFERTHNLFDRLLERLPNALAAPGTSTPEASPASTSRFAHLQAVLARIPEGSECIATWASFMIEEQLTMSLDRARRFQRSCTTLLAQEQDHYEKQLQEQYQQEQQYAAQYHAQQQQQQYERQPQQQQYERQPQQQQYDRQPQQQQYDRQPQQQQYDRQHQSYTDPQQPQTVQSLLQSLTNLLEGSPRTASSGPSTFASSGVGYNQPAATSTLAPYGSSPAGGAQSVAKMSLQASPMKTYTTMYPRRASTSVPALRHGSPMPCSPITDLFDMPHPRLPGTQSTTTTTTTTPVQPTPDATQQETQQETQVETSSASVIVTRSES